MPQLRCSPRARCFSAAYIVLKIIKGDRKGDKTEKIGLIRKIKSLSTKRRVVFAVSGISALGWICFIFANSLKSRAESSAQSAPVAGRLRRILDALGIKGDFAVASYLARKSAHLFEYFVMAFLFYLIFRALRVDKKIAVPLCAIVCFFIGALDETLQYFAERGASFKDVSVDFIGGVIGVCFALAAEKIYRYIRGLLLRKS